MSKHESHNWQTDVTEDPPVCLTPNFCWRLKECGWEVNRLKKEEDLGRERATSCFLSLMTWASAPERLQ
jgi:hypothetical protein